MWFYLVFGVLLVGSIVALIVIAVRKFPQLTMIDADALPQERDRKRKKEIVAQRVHRLALDRWNRTAETAAKPLVRVRDAFRRQFKKLQVLDRQYRNERLLKKEGTREATIAKLIAKAQKLAGKEMYGEAEKVYIEALSIDERDRTAYQGLGELYVTQKRYDRARETFTFLAKMDVREACGQPTVDIKGVPVPRHEAFGEHCPASAATHLEIAKRYIELAEACRGDGDEAAARAAVETAVAFEPANPRYLDLLVEACILEGDRERAEKALDGLRKANPENAKLGTFAERIAAMAGEEEKSTV